MSGSQPEPRNQAMTYKQKYDAGLLGCIKCNRFMGIEGFLCLRCWRVARGMKGAPDE